MRPFARSLASSVLLLWIPLGGAVGDVRADETPSDPRAFLNAAKAQANSVAEQALVLAKHAWPEDPLPAEVSALARQQLIEFGLDGFAALRWAIVNVPPRYQGDAVAAMLECRDRLPHDIPPEYLPALEEAVWYGSVEAKRLALPELAAHRYPPALMTIVDAAFANPELRVDIIETLGLYQSDRVRHFLLKMLREGTPEEARAAAESLARIGDRALGTLRTATADPVPQARVAAVGALLPISTVEDLTRLHEWVALHGSDDAALADRVSERTILLEWVLEQKLAEEAATSLD